MTTRSERQELTKRQEATLEQIALDEGRPARVIGWDTAVQGPLLEIDDFYLVAISPRGKEINRNRREQ